MKNKSAACSTGHGTGVIQGRAPSWPPPGMLKARPGYLRKMNTKLIQANRAHAHEHRKMTAKLRDAEKLRLETADRLRRAEEALSRASHLSLLSKMAAKLRGLFVRTKAAPPHVYRNKT